MPGQVMPGGGGLVAPAPPSTADARPLEEERPVEDSSHAPRNAQRRRIEPSRFIARAPSGSSTDPEDAYAGSVPTRDRRVSRESIEEAPRPTCRTRSLGDADSALAAARTRTWPLRRVRNGACIGTTADGIRVALPSLGSARTRSRRSSPHVPPLVVRARRLLRALFGRVRAASPGRLRGRTAGRRPAPRTSARSAERLRESGGGRVLLVPIAARSGHGNLPPRPRGLGRLRARASAPRRPRGAARWWAGRLERPLIGRLFRDRPRRSRLRGRASRPCAAGRRAWSRLRG